MDGTKNKVFENTTFLNYGGDDDDDDDDDDDGEEDETGRDETGGDGTGQNCKVFDSQRGVFSQIFYFS